MASAAVASTTPAVLTPAQPAKALTEAELTDIFRSRQAELQALVAVSCPRFGSSRATHH